MAFLLLRLGIYISQICSAALMSVGLKVLRLIRSAQTDPCIPEAFHDLSEMSVRFLPKLIGFTLRSVLNFSFMARLCLR